MADPGSAISPQSEPTGPAGESLDIHLERIRGYLGRLGFERHPHEVSPLRDGLATFIETHVEEAIDLWIGRLRDVLEFAPDALPVLRRDLSTSTLRWAAHIRDPANLETYAMLQRHARLGYISRNAPSQFLAGDMLLGQILRRLLREHLPHGPDREAIEGLLEQEFMERLLHVTDFFVEGREQDIVEQQRSYRRSMNLAPSPIFVVRADSGAVVDSNLVAQRHLGSRLATAPPLWDLHPEGERQSVRDLLEETAAEGFGVRENLHLCDAEGGTIPVDVRTARVEFRTARGVLAIYVDLSARRRMEFELVQAEKMAGIGQLAAGIAHEIRNPLGIIRTALYDLAELLPNAPPEVVEDLRIARTEMARVQNIIASLLEFSRDEKVETQAFDLNQLVRTTLTLMDQYLASHGVRVRAELAPIPPCVANANGIRQALLNLVTNAAQAMPGGGELILATSAPASDRVRFEISDSGGGISADSLGRIFEPFYTTKGPGKGTGLGLSIVHSVIEKSRGTIEVKSPPGEGARFIIELPAAESRRGYATGGDSV